MRALARENADIVDGPYAGRFTAYGLYLESPLEFVEGNVVILLEECQFVIASYLLAYLLKSFVSRQYIGHQ